MPHEPRQFIDKEHAEMMVYALEEHFLRIAKILDFVNVPKQCDDKNLVCSQRVEMLGLALLDSLPIENPNYDWDRLSGSIPPDTSEEEQEDPEDVAEKIQAVYGPVEHDSWRAILNSLQVVSAQESDVFVDKTYLDNTKEECFQTLLGRLRGNVITQSESAYLTRILCRMVISECMGATEPYDLFDHSKTVR